MIKDLGKFFSIPIHEFHIGEKPETDDWDPFIEKIALVHKDKYFIFGILIEKQYFYPIKKQILENLSTDRYSDFGSKFMRNYMEFIVNSDSIQELKTKYIGYITLNEYLEKYEPEKLKKD